MMLRRLQQAGHKPIVLMGGGTTKVGDPTGKDESAQAADRRRHRRRNIAGSSTVFEKFLTFGDGPTDAVMVDNDDWLSKLGYVEFLREFGVALHGQPHAGLRLASSCGSSASSR